MILPADSSAPRISSKRVLFLNANETMRPYRVAPLGLAFVASATRAAGHDVRFVDLPENTSQHRAFRRVLSEWPADYLAVGIRNLDNSDFHGFESYLRQPAALVAEARRARPGIRVILGGPAATVDPQLVLRTVQPDHVVLGEGEESLPHAIARLEAGESLPAIIGADEESRAPYRVLNTGALPAPRLYEWVTNLRPYLRGDAGYPLQTKRGCPLKCTYCTYGRIEGTRYRFLDPQAIADEVEGAMARGVRDFEFVDSTFNLPPRHALGVLAALRERRLHANYVGTGLNPAKLPDELLAAMREVGFRSVILTAESASDTMLASYKKNYRRGELHTAADLLAKHDIKALWVFLLGGPGETPATVGESLGFIEERVRSPHAVYITSGIRIYAGSPIADDADSGLFVKEDLRQRSELPGLEFFYSHDTPPEWLEPRLRSFQQQQPHVMLSCEGHSTVTQAAMRVMNYLPFRKPYWQYIPALNRFRRLFIPADKS
ncbi:MAG: radical SAM protein [Verrucomicrobiota bacterium]